MQIPRYPGALVRKGHKITPLINYDLSLNELGEIGRPGGTAAFRRSGVALIWTLLPVFDMYVLNIFTQREHVFWNFCVYNRLFASELQLDWQYRTSGRINKTHSVLTRLIKQAGHKKKSDFASTMLGAWTRTPEFNPNEIPTELRGLGFRHLSMLVPKGDRDAVQNHFEEQIKYFADGALFSYPEKDRTVDFDNLRGTSHWRLLNEHIVKMNSEDRAWLYDEVRKYESNDALVVLAASLDPRFAIRGLFSLFPVWPRFVPFVDLDRYAEVLRFRTRLALIVCPLPQIEKFTRDIHSNLGKSEYSDNVHDELLAMLAARLEPYRAITEFEYPSSPIHS